MQAARSEQRAAFCIRFAVFLGIKSSFYRLKAGLREADLLADMAPLGRMPILTISGCTAGVGKDLLLRDLASLGLGILAYCTAATLWCGDPIMPLAQLILFPDHLGIDYWGLAIIASAIIAWQLVSLGKVKIAQILLFPIFVVAWMSLSVLSVGLYADWIRRERIAEFKPDLEIQHSFFRSIREAPREPQPFLHAVVLKKCQPYIWSYRAMKLFPLGPNVAVNVLPGSWIRQCGIKRTN
jgi:hypothetical protein